MYEHFEIPLCEHDEIVDSANPSLFRVLVNFVTKLYPNLRNQYIIINNVF